MTRLGRRVAVAGADFDRLALDLLSRPMCAPLCSLLANTGTFLLQPSAHSDLTSFTVLHCRSARAPLYALCAPPGSSRTCAPSSASDRPERFCVALQNNALNAVSLPFVPRPSCRASHELTNAPVQHPPVDALVDVRPAAFAWCGQHSSP